MNYWKKAVPRAIAAFALVLLTADIVTTCPTDCSCPTPEVVNCVNSELVQVPEDIPSTATTIDLSHNSISNLSNDSFGDLPVLQSLDLTDNKITNVADETFIGLGSLQVLKLSNNSIEIINLLTFAELGNLSDLTLDFNPGIVITEGALHVLTSLETLHMNGCGSKAGQYSFSDMRSLRELKLSHCDLHQLDPGSFQNMESLENLTITHNAFHEFPSAAVEALGSLTMLNLKVNSIDLNVGKLITTPSSITHLHLDINEIGLVSQDTFHDMRQLQLLTLTDNNIRTLPETLFTGIPATSASLQLELAGNPLQCDCDLRWLLKWSKDNSLDDAVCKEPEENKHAILKTLEPAQAACRPYETAGKHTYHAHVGEIVAMGCPIFIDDYATVQWSYDCGEVVEIPSTFPLMPPYSIDADHALVIEGATTEICETYICSVTTTVGSVSTDLTLAVHPESKDLNGVVIALSVGISVFALLVIVALVMLGMKNRRQETEARPATGVYSNLTESMTEITTG